MVCRAAVGFFVHKCPRGSVGRASFLTALDFLLVRGKTVKRILRPYVTFYFDFRVL